MELLIDQRRADLASDEVQIPPIAQPLVQDIEAARVGRRLKLKLPATPTNDRIFGFGRDPESADRFNRQLHRAELHHEGALLMAGVVSLESSSLKAGYTILIREGGVDWAEEIAHKSLRSLAMNCTTLLTPTAITEGWKDENPIKFFPVQRDSYAEESSSSDLQPKERVMTTDDYYPFLAVEPMVRQIFTEAGYTVESEFLRSPLFRSLYMSGAYATTDTTAARNRMGFLARRLTSVTAESDYFGRLYADPSAPFNSVGNLVETATPYQLDEDGVAVQGLYANGNCFSMEEGRILFRPLSSVRVAFEYYLKYTTDHYIYTRDRLLGFDSFYGGVGSVMNFGLTNRYVDHRNDLALNRRYLVVVFNHSEEAQYRLTYTVDGVSGVELATFHHRSTHCTTSASATTLLDPRLEVLNAEGVWEEYTDDWALYDGHLEERGQTLVEVRLTTPVEELTPDKPKYFDRIFFEGAAVGLSMTLSKECAIRPIFSATPSYGTTLTFEDVARHSAQQIDLITALAHLFNLRFVTDRQRRVVRIEPYDDFVVQAPEVDWSHRVELGEAVILSDTASTLAEQMTLCYQSGDGPVVRLENEEGKTFASWSYQPDSYAVAQGERTVRNPLFHPSLSSINHYANAPSAQLLVAGDRTLEEEESRLPLTARLVSYRGLQPLPEGEKWGFPLFDNRYPLICFHQPPTETEEEGFTLCFDDRDGVPGLNRFWQQTWREVAEAGQLSLTLRLAPHEWEQLTTEAGHTTLLSTIRVCTPEGHCRGRFVEVGPYDAKRHLLRCTLQCIER